jgi:hypothetical protein
VPNFEAKALPSTDAHSKILTKNLDLTMSALEVPVSATRNRFKSSNSPSTPTTTREDQAFMNGTPRTATSAHSHHGRVTSIERLQADLRSPRTRPGPEYPLDARDDAVEMSLLGNEYRDDRGGLLEGEEEDENKDKTPKPLSKKDKKAMALLIVLCK